MSKAREIRLSEEVVRAIEAHLVELSAGSVEEYVEAVLRERLRREGHLARLLAGGGARDHAAAPGSRLPRLATRSPISRRAQKAYEARLPSVTRADVSRLGSDFESARCLAQHLVRYL